MPLPPADLPGSPTIAPPALRETLSALIGRIAAGDRAALQTLYSSLGDIVHAEVRRALSDPDDVQAAVYATFVEVWWLARFHTRDGADIPTWITVVAGRRAAERRWAATTAKPRIDTFAYGVDSNRTALAGLLGRALPA
ncbi:hypothetical protein ACWKSP_41390 [Micromonosporaceae bacterium Da 78-11]